MTTINGIKAEDVAKVLLIGAVNNTMNGRLSGEIIPYYYCNVADDYGLGVSFHYDSEIGLSYNLYIPNEPTDIDLDDDDAVNEFQEYCDFVEVVEWCIEGCLNAVSLTDDFYDNVEKYQISPEDADAKTRFLFENKCMMYV
jgi:hypothetical protein